MVFHLDFWDFDGASFDRLRFGGAARVLAI
jgi:hypothetical protein